MEILFTVSHALSFDPVGLLLQLRVLSRLYVHMPGSCASQAGCTFRKVSLLGTLSSALERATPISAWEDLRFSPPFPVPHLLLLGSHPPLRF